MNDAKDNDYAAIQNNANGLWYWGARVKIPNRDIWQRALPCSLDCAGHVSKESAEQHYRAWLKNQK